MFEDWKVYILLFIYSEKSTILPNGPFSQIRTPYRVSSRIKSLGGVGKTVDHSHIY